MYSRHSFCFHTAGQLLWRKHSRCICFFHSCTCSLGRAGHKETPWVVDSPRPGIRTDCISTKSVTETIWTYGPRTRCMVWMCNSNSQLTEFVVETGSRVWHVSSVRTLFAINCCLVPKRVKRKGQQEQYRITTSTFTATASTVAQNASSYWNPDN